MSKNKIENKYKRYPYNTHLGLLIYNNLIKGRFVNTNGDKIKVLDITERNVVFEANIDIKEEVSGNIIDYTLPVIVDKTGKDISGKQVLYIETLSSNVNNDYFKQENEPTFCPLFKITWNNN